MADDQRRRPKPAKDQPHPRSPKAIVGAIFGRKAPSVKDTLTVVGLKKALIVGLLSNNSEVHEDQRSKNQHGQQERKAQSPKATRPPKCESESMSSLSLEDRPKAASTPAGGATATPSTKPKAIPTARAKRRSQIASFHASFASSSVSSHSSDEASASPSKKAGGAHSRRRARGASWQRKLGYAEDEETSSPETDSSATSFATLMFAKDMPKLSQKYLNQIPLRENGACLRPTCKSAPISSPMYTFGSDPSLAGERRDPRPPGYVRKRPPRRHSNFMHSCAERAELRRASELPQPSQPSRPYLGAGMKSLSTNLPPQRPPPTATGAPQSPKAALGRPFHSTYSNLLTVPDPFPWESASPARPIVKPRHSRSLSIRTQLQRQESFEKSATSSLEGESTPTAESLPKLSPVVATAAAALPTLCARCSKSLDQIEEGDGDETGADGGGSCESEGYVSTVRRKKSACSAWQRSQSCNAPPSNTTCVSADVHKENSEDDESSGARVKVTDL